jgi:replicative DNA helicase
MSSHLVFSPTEILTASQSYLERRRTNAGKGVPLYIPQMDYDPVTEKGFLPVLPGELISIIARPGNGKTSFLMRWARKRAAWLRDNQINDRVVMYLTLEQTVEELATFHLAAETKVSITTMAFGSYTDEQWQAMKTANAHRVETPLWFIGYSSERKLKRRERITLDTVEQALEDVEKWQGNERTQRVDLLFIDYLQRFHNPAGSESRVVGLGDITEGVKELGLQFGCGTVMGVQAKREVEQRKYPIPQMEDGQWTSNIEQTSDGVITLVRPRHYVKENEMFGDGAQGVIVKGYNQMLVSICKRKLGPEGFAKWIEFDPRYNELIDAEYRHIDFNTKEGI